MRRGFKGPQQYIKTVCNILFLQFSVQVRRELFSYLIVLLHAHNPAHLSRSPLSTDSLRYHKDAKTESTDISFTFF